MPEQRVLHVVLGATGRIGGAVAADLLDRGERVRAVTRDAARAEALSGGGAETAVADLEDPRALDAALAAPHPVRVFVLNPPGPVTGDPDVQEHRTGEAVAAALDRARIDRVVLLSTYGARPGDRIGDLGTLHRLETLLAAQPAPLTALRAAYLFSNWDGTLARARSTGRLPVMLDPDRPLPMVDPADVGAEAARLLAAEEPRTGVVPIEGPRRWTPREVAAIVAGVVGRPVEVDRVPRDGWADAFAAAGLSPEAAASYGAMTAITDEEDWRGEGDPVRGSTMLEDHLARLATP